MLVEAAKYVQMRIETVVSCPLPHCSCPSAYNVKLVHTYVLPSVHGTFPLYILFCATCAAAIGQHVCMFQSPLKPTYGGEGLSSEYLIMQ